MTEIEKGEISVHDVGLVNGSHFAPPLLGGIIEGELGDAARLLSGDNLQTFNHTRYTLKSRPKIIKLLLGH